MKDDHSVEVLFRPADDGIFVSLIEGLSICADGRCRSSARGNFERTRNQAASAGLGSHVLIAELLKALTFELAGDLEGAFQVLDSVAETAEEAEYWKCFAMAKAWQGRLHARSKHLDLASEYLKKASEAFREIGDEFHAGYYKTMANRPKLTLVP